MHPLYVPAFARLSDWLGLWSMEPRSFAMLAEGLRRMDLAAHVAAPPVPVSASTELVQSRDGSNVAIIRLTGTLMKAASSLGGTSTVQVRRNLREAAADPNISAILLAIDSPGGTVAGTDDLAADVRAARRRKPVVAHIDDLGASAAYWIASQAERVYANSGTALIGSIGTMMTVVDASEAFAKEGLRAIVAATGPLKAVGAFGTKVTDDQAAYLQRLVEQSQAAFDDAVRRGRGLTERQLADVRTGAVFIATEAMEKKLIDGIQPLSKTISQLQAGQTRRAVSSQGVHAMSDNIPVATFAPPLDADNQAGAELARVRTIDQLCQKAATDFARDKPDSLPRVELIRTTAIESGWDAQRVQLELMREARHLGPIVLAPRERPTGPMVYAAALAMSAGLPDRQLQHAFDVRTLEAASGKHLRGFGLSGLVRAALEERGERITGRLTEQHVRMAFAPTFYAAAPSTIHVPEILSAAATKVLESAYAVAPSPWRTFAAVRYVPNFKTHTGIRPSF